MGERGARPSFSKFGDKKPYGKSFGDRSYDSRESSAPRRQYERKEFTPAPAASDRKQLDEINSKLDRLIAAIERMTDDK